ncbi:MAG: class I SAM-dependent methyltransferase [Candidatus Omnitrophica bacterium]|nr:class I SAM-dependent methyltransferase [Candidatus Omnitrophota bacterium]MBI3021832.1 class I SAM-dependent methyltransferase [Candidatus Omnitrophota bacterium]
MSQWYDDWQHQRHAEAFDGRWQLDRRNLIRNQEGFNDVRLLNERIDQDRSLQLLEVGCATGEFYRYLRSRYPYTRYYGLDVSGPAIARAKQKYAEGTFIMGEPAASISATLRLHGLPEHPHLVYAKDVIQHQTEPLAFLSELIRIAEETVIVRCRTRDVGHTEWDPERSCQYHYEGWMPFIVLNLQELIDAAMAEALRAEVVVYRSHIVLGGTHNRFVPKELFVASTGTAETALGVFKRTAHSGRVTIADRLDQNPRYTWDYVLKHAARQAWDALRVCRVRDAGPPVVAQFQWSRSSGLMQHDQGRSVEEARS